MRHDHELTTLVRLLSQRLGPAKPLLLVADALGIPARRLLTFRRKDFETSLRRISLDRLEEVMRASSSADSARSKPVSRPPALSLEVLARYVLEQPNPGSKLDIVEQAIVARALSYCGGNQSAAARLLGIDRKALARRLVKQTEPPARNRRTA